MSWRHGLVRQLAKKHSKVKRLREEKATGTLGILILESSSSWIKSIGVMKRNDGWLFSSNQAYGMEWNRRLVYIRIGINKSSLFSVFYFLFFVDISSILYAHQCYTLLCYQNPTMSGGFVHGGVLFSSYAVYQFTIL